MPLSNLKPELTVDTIIRDPMRRCIAASSISICRRIHDHDTDCRKRIAAIVATRQPDVAGWCLCLFASNGVGCGGGHDSGRTKRVRLDCRSPALQCRNVRSADMGAPVLLVA